MKAQRSPLRGRYLVRHPLWNLWLRANDFVLETLGSSNGSSPAPAAPRRVLIAVGGHLGDGVIATSIFAPLRAAFPGVEIGVVTGSWNRDVFSDHPQVRWLHLVDHWKLNRTRRWLPARWWGGRRTKARALGEIAAVGYDAAVDLYAYYPNSARLFARAGIPIRVGFRSGGDGPLYTHAVDWRAGQHSALDHLTLLRILGPMSQASELRYSLAEVLAGAVQSAEQKLSSAGVALDNFVVIHSGAGGARKEWRVEHWRAVARELCADGTHVVLTGAGGRQEKTAADIAREIPGVANMCDRLSWQELRHTLGRARLVLSVDTVAMHLAAAAGTPCVAIMTGMDDPERWRPLGERVTVLSEAVPCSPCYRSNGCGAMTCVRGVSPAAVMTAARMFLDVPAATHS